MVVANLRETVAAPAAPEQAYGPWNPGIESTLPNQLLPLATTFSQANVSSSIAQLREISGFCGLTLERLSTFKPERLALHEVLIRVMADLSVPDGEKYEDLGVNFRRMTATIMDKYIAPELATIEQSFDRLRRQAEEFIDRAQMDARPTAAEPEGELPNASRWAWLLSAGRRTPPVRTRAPDPADRDAARIAAWREKMQSAASPFERACYQALVTVAEAIVMSRGRLTHDSKLITSIALRLVCNEHGSMTIGEMIEPLFVAAARREGYRFLPAQSQPIIMNVKGASASGKSTMRPLQRQLAARIGMNWADFALISPDIWRKYLLDYSSLGAARRYAGSLTGTEVAIIDQKLDRYMSHKDKIGRLPHLLIDRFRFDSFAQEPNEADGSRLLTRFGSEVFMFFMITPPEATIERAWTRGEQLGRYKAVDDLLAHNVEAYSGIPGLFFMWALRDDKRVHFEFLDNSVPEGHRPRTVAFGLNGRMNILDLNCLLDIDRYRDINIEARTPDEIYAKPLGRGAASHSDLLKLCVRRIPELTFARQETGEIYARIVNGDLVLWNRAAYELAVREASARAAFESIVRPPAHGASGSPGDLDRLDPRQHFTLGQWAGGR